MAYLPLLQKIEDFLIKDLNSENLNPKNSVKRLQLAAKLREVIEESKSSEKLEKFLNEQRSKTRSSVDVVRPNLPLPKVPPDNPTNGVEQESAAVEELYMDLNEPFPDDERNLSPASLSTYNPSECSGSGYESYPSEDEQATAAIGSNKADKEAQELNNYFAGTNCDVYSYVFLENKTFLSGKKWIKRVGIVRENHFQCFKKLGDNHALLDLPLRSYSVQLGSKNRTNSLIINLESSGSQGGDGYRFYVANEKSDEWSRALREKSASVVQTGTNPAPPVATRPVTSLPRSERPMTRQPSLGVADLPLLSINDKPIRIEDNYNASLQTTATNRNNISKGLKSAFSDMLSNPKRKDKNKKKIIAAEQMGAEMCGTLEVYGPNKWSNKFCVIINNALHIYGKEEAPEITRTLHGCDLQPYFDEPERKFTFKLIKEEKDLLFLSTSSSEEMGKWIGKLIAETGCAEIPENSEVSESIYVEPDIYNSVMDRAREVFQQTVKTKKQHNKTKPLPLSAREEAKGTDNYVDLELNQQPPNLPSISPKPKRKAAAKFQNTSNISSGLDGSNPVPPARTKQKKKSSSSSITVDSDVETIQSPARPLTHLNFKKPAQSESKDKLSSPKDKIPMPRTPEKDLEKTNIVSFTGGYQLTDTSAPSGRSEGINTDQKFEKEKVMEKRLEEIRNRLRDLKVKKAELAKYVEAASTSKQKAGVDALFRDVNKEINSLEEERVNLERPHQQKPRTHSNQSGGNVMSRAKMFENL